MCRIPKIRAHLLHSDPSQVPPFPSLLAMLTHSPPAMSGSLLTYGGTSDLLFVEVYGPSTWLLRLLTYRETCNLPYVPPFRLRQPITRDELRPFVNMQLQGGECLRGLWLANHSDIYLAEYFRWVWTVWTRPSSSLPIIWPKHCHLEGTIPLGSKTRQHWTFNTIDNAAQRQ